MPDSRVYRRLSMGLLGLMLLLIGLLLDDHGISWDEQYHIDWGEAKWEFYAGLLKGDKSLEDAASLSGSIIHPGFFDLTAALLRRILPWDANTVSHLLSALFGWAGLVGVWQMGRLVGGERVGFFALVSLILLPRYFGHLWFNPKDIPFAACHIWALYFGLRFLMLLPKPSWSSALLFGLCVGLALGVRIAGLLLPCYVLLGMGLYYAGRWRIDQQPLKALACEWPPQLLKLAAGGLLAFVVVLPFWPVVWLDTGERGGDGAVAALDRAQNFDWNAPVLFDGDIVLSNELPWYYLPKWLLVTTPEWLLLLLAIGCALAVTTLRGLPKTDWFREKTLASAVIVFATGFPIGYVILTGPTIYDGLRHFLWLLPLMAILGGLSLEHLLNRFEPQRQLRVAAVAGFAWLTTLFQYVTLHPYQYVYFNAFTGGLAGAYERWETDYWALSYREACETFEALLDDVYGTAPRPEIKVMLMRSTADWLVEPFLPEGCTLTRNGREAHFVITYTRMLDHAVLKHKAPHARVVGLVERQAAPLNFIFLLRPPEGFLDGLANSDVPEPAS